MYRLALASLVAILAAVLMAAAPAAAQDACHPIQTPPQFLGSVPKVEEVVANPGGGGGEVTTAQAYQYMDAVDAASDRVITGALDQVSWEGRQLRWAIVGDPTRLANLDAVKAAAQALRNPTTSPEEAAALADSAPAVLWVASNVHGGEESGTDASLRVLYELADRTDCAAQRILDNAVVVLLPVQNPDGREADSRRNHYGFDMNRDWFARTQPETDAKVEMLREYPGPLFIDAHEMGAKTYFFPPNADPVYHEITDESIDWINDVYGAAMAAEFRRQKIPFFNRDVYDLFYMGYGDTVPSTGFISAGMTFEKSSGDPIAQRAYEQYVTQWVSLSEGARLKETILSDWAAAWREAYRQGGAGELEPNELVNKGKLVNQVPNMRVRHYFVRSDDPDKQTETQALVRRLQRMDVDVYQLSEPLTVPDFTPYGRASGEATLPAGTYWIPMAQMQKHWVQAMLNEDTYTPFPYFYDVTAWSQPLLFNVQGGYSGAELSPAASLAAPAAEPDRTESGAAPRIALWQMNNGTAAIESAGWLRYLLERVWGLGYANVSTTQVGAGGLADYDVLLIPDGGPQTAEKALGKSGAQRLRSWVNGGGHVIAWTGGAELAARVGVTTARLSAPHSDVPGSLFRVRMNGSSPLSDDVGPFAYAFYEYDSVMEASSPAHVAMQFPSADSADWFVSGFAHRADELGGTAAAIDETIGAGRATIFSIEPNFRAFTTGTQKVLRNAILGGGLTSARAAARRASRVDIRRARRAARELVGSSQTIRLSVRRPSAARAARVLRRFRARYRVQRTRGRTAFLIANPRGLSGDEHPFASRLPRALERADVATIAFRAP